jgi:hypothetical protein
MAATFNLNELNADQCKQLGVRKPRESQFTKDDLRV